MALDRESTERIRVIVIATTTAMTNLAYDYATVWISVTDINDNSPRFGQDRYLSKVWENQPRGTFVAQVSNQVFYRFTHSFDHRHLIVHVRLSMLHGLDGFPIIHLISVTIWD